MSNSRVLAIWAGVSLASVLVINAMVAVLGWDPLAYNFVNGELVSIDSWSFGQRTLTPHSTLHNRVCALCAMRYALCAVRCGVIFVF